MNKNVLIIVTKGDTGGAQQSVFNLAKGLKDRSINVTVAFGEGNFLQNKLQAENINFHRFRCLKRTKNALINLLFILEMKKYLEKNSFTTVHFNSSNALIGAIGAKLSKNKPKIIFTFRGLSLVDQNYTSKIFPKILFYLYFKILLKFVDNQIYVSQENQKYCQKIGLAKNDSTIYNGLPILDFLNKETARKQLSAICKQDLSNNFIIGSIGRLAYQKNYEFLIKVTLEILKINPLTKIIIIGEGSEREKYSNLINQFGLENQILLMGDEPDAYRYLKAFDVFALTSRYEGMSITLIEAMQAGLPILASNVGGAQEMLNNEKMIYEMDNQKEFLDRLNTLICDESTRKDISLQAKVESQKFDIKNTIDSYLKIYQ